MIIYMCEYLMVGPSRSNWVGFRCQDGDMLKSWCFYKAEPRNMKNIIPASVFPGLPYDSLSSSSVFIRWLNQGMQLLLVYEAPNTCGLFYKSSSSELFLSNGSPTHINHIVLRKHCFKSHIVSTNLTFIVTQF